MRMKAKRRHSGLMYQMILGRLNINNRLLGCHQQVKKREYNNQIVNLWEKFKKSREYQKLWELLLRVMDLEQYVNMMKLISTIQTDQTRTIKWCPKAAWWALRSIKTLDFLQILLSKAWWVKTIKRSNAPLSKELALASTMTMDLKWHKELNLTLF